MELNALCMEILKKHSPEAADGAASWQDAVQAEMERDPEAGVALWRAILDGSGADLAGSEEAAKTLLHPFIAPDWLRTNDIWHLMPFLIALKEERFAKQMFQSAFVGKLQLDLLHACDQMGKKELGEDCIRLLEKSSYPQEKWSMPLAYFAQAITSCF